ncbi:MAG: sulfur carrier protein ThiS [Zoogloeaceae bacterium]|nr:sulfur carrier protein ThiS [Zoogloeaceae bacterium]
MNRVQVNGELLEIPRGWRLSDLLLDLGHAGRRVAVERNGQIVPRSAHDTTPLQDQDRIEIVAAVGGG